MLKVAHKKTQSSDELTTKQVLQRLLKHVINMIEFEDVEEFSVHNLRSKNISFYLVSASRNKIIDVSYLNREVYKLLDIYPDYEIDYLVFALKSAIKRIKN